GVVAATLLMWRLVVVASHPMDARALRWWAAMAAVLSYANYQVMVMIPLAYAALVGTELVHHRPRPLREMFRRYAVSAGLFMLFIVGAVGLARTRTPQGTALSIFVGLVALTVGFLNAMWRFPLGPTRHLLVFTPIVLFLISLGIAHLRTSGNISFAVRETG